MKGIVLAGGSGSRLYPITKGISKQLIPVHDKPLIYYSISVLMLAGIKEILIITTLEDQFQFKKLLGNGVELGCKFSYEIQEKPNGLAIAFVIGEEFIGKDKVALILGDNIFYGSGFRDFVQSHNNVSGATIFAYKVNDPHRFGIVEFDKNDNIISLEEKPKNPKSNYAIPGLYFYDNRVVEIAKSIKPSERGEFEITDVNKVYFEMGELNVGVINRGTTWIDTGTIDSLAEASQFVRLQEKSSGSKISCIEEIAYRMGFIDKSQFKDIASKYSVNAYGKYLLKISR
jgi:glucose-1-phosphate thymidylyltransferase